MPTIPLLVLSHVVMTMVMKGIDNPFTNEERNILRNEQPIGMDGHDKLLYADDTLILASSR